MTGGMQLNFGGKCPCCNNPWQQDFASVCEPCRTAEPESTGVDKPPIDPADFDPSIDPGDDFYSYAIGGWKQKNPIPSEYPSWDVFTMLHDQNQKRLKEIVDGMSGTTAASSAQTPSSDDEKVAAFFAAAMEEAKINETSLQTTLGPMFSAASKEELEKDGAAGGLTTVLATLCREYGVEAPFRFSAAPDKANSGWYIAQLSQGGLGLPDRDYYFDEDKQDKREDYQKHLAKIFQLLQEHLPEHMGKVFADAGVSGSGDEAFAQVGTFSLKMIPCPYFDKLRTISGAWICSQARG